MIVQAVNRATGERQTHTCNYPFAIVGRAQHAGVHLNDPSVSQCHAYLQIVDGVPYCIDLGSRTGVLWDDGSQGRGWIHAGQTVRIGLFDVQISVTGCLTPNKPDPGSSSEHKQQVTLEVHAPNLTGGQYSLDFPVTLVGRHPNCGLRFLDEGVAYFQCVLVNTSEGLWCVDLLSQRGTFINGRATRLSPLRDGDLIEAGRVSLVVRTTSRASQGVAHPGTGDAGTMLSWEPGARANGGVSPFDMLRDMMEQFQQCFMTMARMFTTMQQEHTAMMCEQMRQIQELLREQRATPALPAGAAPASLHSTTPAAPASPTTTPAPCAPAASPKPSAPKPTPEEERVLAAAHAWFLGRLTQKMSQPTGAPKSD